jgi:uncharacterized protein with HEPN domain
MSHGAKDADYREALADILDACRKARTFVSELSKAQFMDDDKTRFAVVRAIEIIGEAARAVPAEERRRHPDIPWRAMAGMRDKLIHHYAAVNWAVVWRTIQEDLPALERQVRMILES